MQTSRAFSRFNSFMALLQAAMAQGVSQLQAYQAIGEYKSRGHGKGTPGKLYRRNGAGTTPHGGGKREVARRQRQLASGMIRVSA